MTLTNYIADGIYIALMVGAALYLIRPKARQNPNAMATQQAHKLAYPERVPMGFIPPPKEQTTIQKCKSGY